MVFRHFWMLFPPIGANSIRWGQAVVSVVTNERLGPIMAGPHHLKSATTKVLYGQTRPRLLIEFHLSLLVLLNVRIITVIGVRSYLIAR